MFVGVRFGLGFGSMTNKIIVVNYSQSQESWSRSAFCLSEDGQIVPAASAARSSAATMVVAKRQKKADHCECGFCKQSSKGLFSCLRYVFLVFILWLAASGYWRLASQDVSQFQSVSGGMGSGPFRCRMSLVL